MNTGLTRDKLLMIIPIIGWLFIAYGVLYPFENSVLRILWFIDIFLSIVVHPLQLFIAIPVGKKAGISVSHTIFYTIIFGATWWKPIRRDLGETK